MPMKNLKCLLAFVHSCNFVFRPGIGANATYLSLVDLGDTTPEIVVTGNSGTNTENLEYWFSQNDITNPDANGRRSA